MQAPDFSEVTTRTVASRLVRKRQLVKIHLVPIALGGVNARYNIIYVTPEAAVAHAQLTATLARYAERDLVDHLKIEPDYKGLSIVPTRLRVKATHRRGSEGFESVIDIWGCGFCVPYVPPPDPDEAGETTA